MASGKRLEGRIALVTGASRGIGRAVALRFAEEGAELVLVARTQGALEEVDDEIRALGGTAILSPADITDYEKIDQMGAAIFERFKRLDILVGNAGALGTLGPVGHMPPEEWENVMAVNITANWRLIRAFDRLLRASDAGRAIFVTSAAVRLARAYWSGYAVGKSGLETLVRVYAHEVEKSPVRVNLVSPGPTRTRMRAEAYPGEDPNTLRSPEDITDCFVDLAAPDCTKNGEVVEGY